MRGYDVIHELYLGNLRPCDRGVRNDTDLAITMDVFASQESWLRENLNGETAKRFDELVSCHNSIVDTMSYESFRTGFQLGTMMVMEAVSSNESVLFELQ